MMAIGRNFAFIIFVMGTITAVHISDEERKQFYQDILAVHNLLRDWHYAEPLKLDQEICDLIKVHTDKLEANKETQIPADYGISVFTIEFEDKPLLDANWIVYLWYSKGLDYNYLIEPSPPSKDIGAFTQLIWKNTTKIGVGMWIKDKKCCVVVAYSPRGNQIGEYFTNVLPPRSITNTND